jgi:hypothetical protein
MGLPNEAGGLLELWEAVEAIGVVPMVIMETILCCCDWIWPNLAKIINQN